MEGYNYYLTSKKDKNKTNNKKKGKLGPKKIEYEPAPAKRNRIARKLVQKMRHIIYEYSVKTGEQITGVFVDKPNAQTRDYKIYGTKPLVSVMDDLKCTIDDKYTQSLNDEKTSTPNIGIPKLPILTVDGNATKLEYFTQSQLRKFIPQLIKYSTGRHYTGWNNSSFRPVWWPKDLAWSNVRYDIRTSEQKTKESWTGTLQRIIRECYKYYGHEEMLLGGSEIREAALPKTSKENSVASTSTNEDFEEIKIFQPLLIENGSTFHGFKIMNEIPAALEPHLKNNTMYLLQTVGPSTSLLHPIHIVPVKTINLENTNSCCVNDLINNLKQTTNDVTITQLNDEEVIDGACASTSNETFANVKIVQDSF